MRSMTSSSDFLAIQTDPAPGVTMPLATRLSIVLLAAIAVLHLLRLAYGVQVVVDGMVIPVWASCPAALVPGLLAFFLWRERRPAP